MRRHLLGIAAVVSSLSATGCLVDRTTHTFYISPNGALTWSVLQEDIRSNEADRSKRVFEEQQFLDSLARNAHPTAIALETVGGEAVRTRRLRMERPYSILTEARFARVDRGIEQFITMAGLRAHASLETHAGVSTLTIIVDGLCPGDDLESDSPAESLIEELGSYRFVLTDGRFTDARGFTIIEDDTVALFKSTSDDELRETDGAVRIWLRWSQDRK